MYGKNSLGCSDDDSDTFVPQDSPICNSWHITFHDMQIHSAVNFLFDNAISLKDTVPLDCRAAVCRAREKTGVLYEISWN
jgi:hypothetical protein